MNIITVGQMQQLTDRYKSIMGSPSTELREKRLMQLQEDIATRFNILTDVVAYQFWLNLAEVR